MCKIKENYLEENPDAMPSLEGIFLKLMFSSVDFAQVYLERRHFECVYLILLSTYFAMIMQQNHLPNSIVGRL